MAKETFPGKLSGPVTVPQESVVLPIPETVEVNWPVHGIRFYRKPCTLIIDVGEPGLADKLIEEPALSELAECGFQLKQELHMTVIGYENGRQILGALKSMPLREQEKVLQGVEDMAKSTDWSWWPTEELQLFGGRREKALKVITRVECPAFDAFYEDLKQLTSTAQFKLYPPHITVLKQPGELKKQNPSRIGELVLSRPLLSLNYPTIDS